MLDRANSVAAVVALLLPLDSTANPASPQILDPTELLACQEVDLLVEEVGHVPDSGPSIRVLARLGKDLLATTDLALYIRNRLKGKDFGLEVEVGEIGRKDDHGMVLTSPEEAVEFIKALQENGVYPQVLAIANGSTHGHVYDEKGNVIEQLSIDIPRTKAVARALRENNLHIGIAQHGITGTPRDLINQHFPKGDIIKGNVGTFWQDLVFNCFKVYEPVLYKEIVDWTLEKYRPLNPGKKTSRVFDSNCKFAIKEFYKEIYAVEESTEQAIQAMAYAESLIFFRAFSSLRVRIFCKKKYARKYPVIFYTAERFY